MKVEPVKAGVIGCGKISDAYFVNGLSRFESLRIVACADILEERAEEKAKKFGIKAMSVARILSDPQIEMIINLTVPKVHTDIAMSTVLAGKSVYSEKPMALDRSSAKKLLSRAKAKGILVGGAPDTFLGGGLQTCRKLIDDGVIGEPVAANAFMMCHGHESWHPDPEFYYEKGGGPMLDMGPYYLTALVSLMGPMMRVCGTTRATFATRTITSEKKRGKVIDVETPTHYAGAIDFASGAIATVAMSFDVWAHRLPCIEIHGSEASLEVPDPNSFGGKVTVLRKGKDPQDVPLTQGYTEKGRGMGPADMAVAMRTGRPFRADGELTYHVLDAMLGFEESSASGRHVVLKSTCSQPAPLPTGLADGELD